MKIITNLSLGFFDPHLELDVDDVLPVPAELVLEHDQRFVEEVRDEDKREDVGHLLYPAVNVSLIRV